MLSFPWIIDQTSHEFIYSEESRERPALASQAEAFCRSSGVDVGGGFPAEDKINTLLREDHSEYLDSASKGTGINASHQQLTFILQIERNKGKRKSEP